MSGLLETEVRDGFMQTGTPKMLSYKHGGSRVKLSLWPFCGRIPGPTDSIWATSGLLETRVKEHLSRNSSAVHEHCKLTGHSVDSSKTKVLDNGDYVSRL